MGKRIIGAIVVGGCTGLVAQLIITLLGKFIPDPMLAIILTMFIVAFIGFILIITDVYPKISKFGCVGADISTSGLMYGAANIAAMTRKAGASAGVAFRKGFGMVGAIVFGGFGFGCLVGIVTFFIAK